MIILFSLLISGCARVTVSKDGDYDTSNPSWEEKQDIFVFGLISDEDVQLNEVCPSGTKQLETQITFSDLILTGLTVGIYSPKTARVWCD